MDPKLIYQIETDNREQNFRGIANGEKWEVKNEAVKVCASLSEGGAKVEVFALMMRGMGSPKKRNFMTSSMLPVVSEIVKHKTRHPCPQALF